METKEENKQSSISDKIAACATIIVAILMLCLHAFFAGVRFAARQTVWPEGTNLQFAFFAAIVIPVGLLCVAVYTLIKK